MHYTKLLKTTVKHDEGKVVLSVRVTEDHVQVFRLPIAEFRIMCAEFDGQVRDAQRQARAASESAE